MKTRVLSVFVLAFCAVLAPLVTGASSAWAGDGLVRTDQRCNPDRYRNHFTAVTKDKQAVITHLRAFALPPSSSHTVTKTVSKQTTLQAQANYELSTEISASIAKKIIAAASVSSKMSLQAVGTRTTSSSVTVTDTVGNPGRRNAQFVFFRGDMTAKGAFKHYYCSMYYTPTGPVGYFVHYKTGKWTSFAVYSDGAAKCGAGGSLNAVTKAALAQGC